MADPMKEVAKCERCGRGFVWLNQTSDMVDHYFPANKRLKTSDMPTDEECGGAIVMLENQQTR